MEQTNSGNLGVSENDLVAIGQAVDALHSRIAKMDATIKSQRYSIESLENDKKQLEHLFSSFQKDALNAITSEVVELTEAKSAREIFKLEETINELDAENDIIAGERDALQNKVVQLEAVCNEQKIIIEGFRSKVPLAPAHPVFKSAIDSLKAKLGMNFGGNQD